MKKIIIRYCLIVPTLFFISSMFSQTPNEPAVRKKTGYFNLTSFSAIIGTPNDIFETASITPSLTMVNGFHLNNHFSAGFGVGAEIFKYAVFPVFADIRFKLPRLEYQPYLALKGGYAFAQSSKNLLENRYYPSSYKCSNTGGWMFSPEVGIYFAVSPKIDVAVSLGYRFQQLASEFANLDGNGKLTEYIDNYETTINRLTVNIGIVLR